MKNIAVYLCILFSVALLVNCKPAASEDPAPAVETGNVSVEFDNQFKLNGTSYTPLELNSSTLYTNAGGDQYSISMFKYYISNVKLKKSDGSYYEVPESYYLIDASVSTTIPAFLKNVPVGNYTGIAYTIGVDAARLQDGVQSGTGALSTSNGMFWTWNSGYIFLKLEGNSPQSSDAVAHKIQYHIGGYKSPNSALQSVEHSFGASVLRVTKTGTPKVHIYVEASKVAENLNFNTTPAIHMPGETSVAVSQNYKNMFQYNHIHN